MHRWAAISVVGLLGLGMAPACSSDSNNPDAGQPHSDAGHESGSHAVDPFNGDCSSARWADVPETCWACACTTCKDTLNACGDDCMKTLDCTFKNHTLVNNSADIGCEIRATIVECLNNPTAQAAAPALTQFDGCLLGAPKPGHFRACEVECGIPYSGDVCQRYPEPPPAHPG